MFGIGPMRNLHQKKTHLTQTNDDTIMIIIDFIVLAVGVLAGVALFTVPLIVYGPNGDGTKGPYIMAATILVIIGLCIGYEHWRGYVKFDKHTDQIICTSEQCNCCNKENLSKDLY